MKRLIAVFLFLSGCATGSSQAPTPEPTAAAVPTNGVLTEVPFFLHDNRILVNVMLNGQGPFVMIFDTGGSNCMTPEVQKLLDVKSQGSEYTTGAGPKKVKGYSVHVQSLQVGNFKLEDQNFTVLSLSAIRKAFRFSHLDGVIGYEVLQQARARIDFDRQVIQLRAANAPALERAHTVAFELVGSEPVVDGKINGHPAKILLDTGDRSNLTLFRKFAVASKLNKIFAQRETVLTGLGVGGAIPGKVSSLDKVEIGSEAMTDVMTRLPVTKGGTFYTSTLSASAGLGLLKAYNLEFDYLNKTLSLQKREGYNEPSTFTPVR